MGKLKLPRYMRMSRGRMGCWRWEPGGDARADMEKAGFKARDLKDDAGEWLPLEKAAAEAERLNAMLDRWRRGEVIEDENITTRIARVTRSLTVSNMIEAWQDSDSFRSNEPATRKNWESAARNVQSAFGDHSPAVITYQRVLGFHSAMIDSGYWKASLPPRVNGKARRFLAVGDFLALSEATREHWANERREAEAENPDERPGLAMAYQTLKIASIMWTWCGRSLDGFTHPNPFSNLRVSRPKGRVRHITDEELAFIDQASIDIGRPELGDAFMLGVLTAQRRADLCLLTWDIRRTGRVSLKQKKTGKLVDFRASMALQERLETIWTRHRAAGFKRMDRVILSHTGDALDEHPDYLTRDLAKLRARACDLQRAAGKKVTLDDVILHDSRDTAVKRLFELGLDAVRVTEYSGHSLRQLDMIKDAYLANSTVLADQATDALDAAWAKQKRKN